MTIFSHPASAIASLSSLLTTAYHTSHIMEKIKEKLNTLRAEADTAVARAEEAEAKNKKYEQLILEKEQEITSLNHRLALQEGETEKLETQLTAFKKDQVDGEGTKVTNEALVRKVQLLEEELDTAEKNVKDTVEKLRQVDVKAEHFERQVQRAEQERDQWEKKYEEMHEKYQQSKKELDEMVASMEGI